MELDSSTGLHYAKNRWYDAGLARFVTTDPLGYVDGPNLLQYGLNNPVNFSDPMGLCVFGLPCPKSVHYAADVYFGYQMENAANLYELAQGTQDMVTRGESARVREGFRAFATTEGTVGQRLAAGLYTGERAAQAVRTFGFSEAEDPAAHTKELGMEISGGALMREGSIQLTEGLYFGDWGRMASGGAQIWGGMGQVVLLVAGPKAIRGRLPAGTAGLRGSGPAPGVIEVSERFESVSAFRRYSPRPNPAYGGENIVEFVFDPTTNRFAVGRAPTGFGSPHQRLASAIQADETQVLGGTFSRGPGGQILTTEISGHYGTRWTAALARQFVEFLEGRTGQTVHHAAWPTR